MFDYQASKHAHFDAACRAFSQGHMVREVTADDEKRTVVARETMVKATDKTTVIGTAKLMAGAIVQVTTGDYSLGTQGNYVASITGNASTKVGEV
ncbi:hypothetical protein [Obesumbacterium proteus]|uniref:hypothetical protein n=1 Tax=Obesumbacterium proteus TaxID=82983 RepID=UPI00242DA1D1|nr:hypothetical protein [Obesumbacterium proteus]